MHFRRLRMEPLEDRRLLATFTVSNLLDGPVTAAGQRPGTLRQAIFDANASPGADEIVFGSTMGVINLSSGELSITEGLTISGPGRDVLTIDAQALSRIFNFSTTSTTNRNLTVEDLALKNGRSTTGSGGAVRFLGAGTLTVIDSTISDNMTVATEAHGGGLYSQNHLTLTKSIITRNAAEGSNSSGGGIYAEATIQIDDSLISENSSRDSGGGIRGTGTISITDSAITDNSTSGPGASGGGIHGFQDITIVGSTMSGNQTSGQTARGGGVFAIRDLEIFHSTITENFTTGSSAPGGGIAVFASGGGTRTVSISHSIIAENSSIASGPDLIGLSTGTVVINASRSLIGSTNGLTAAQINSIIAGPGNLINVDPLIGPLQDNGGPTPTHALLPGSPALNAGSPSVMAGVGGIPINDQRGTGFTRIWGGRIDIGAFELQPDPSGPNADFDGDREVDGRDFLVWQRGFGKSNAQKADGDADNNHAVNAADLGYWQSQYNLGVIVPTGDFDSDGDVDGRDFLQWQRGYGAAYDHDDLTTWQARYGTEELSALRAGPSSAPVDAALELTWVPAASTRETSSDRETLIEEPQLIELAIDEAFEYWSAPSPTFVRDFGDIVVSRERLPLASRKR